MGLPFSLNWTHLFWVVAGLSALILGALAFVRGRYVIELVAALHSRRLRLESGDEQVIPMDGKLKDMLLGYLRSDLPERCSLALQLLSEHVDDDVVETIEAAWPNWEPWLRADAIKVLAGEPSDKSKAFIQSLGDTESDEVQATALKVFADSMEEAQLRQKISDAPVFTRSEAIAELGNRYGDEAVNELISGLSQSEHDADRKTAALTISKLVSDQFDHFIPKLLRDAPAPLLRLMANRPRVEYAEIVTPWLARDRVFVDARRVLRNLGDDAIDSLKKAAGETTTAAAALDLLAEFESPSARESLFGFIEEDDRDLSLRALVALSQQEAELKGEERTRVEAFMTRAMGDVKRYYGISKSQTGGGQGVSRK